MQNASDIHLLNLFGFIALLIIPAYFLWRWQLLSMSRQMLFSVLRMTLQLLLVGLYLKYIFSLNTLWINIAWVVIMMIVANISIVRGANLSLYKLFWPTQASLLIAISITCLLFLIILVQPQPFYDARYLIPLCGMLLGNCLQGNIRALDTFFTHIRENSAQFTSDLFIGATLQEATQPAFRKALKASLNPTIGTMATLGIVTLPGMMPGQILSGILPLTAAKYQIAIMVGIFMAMMLAIALNLRFSLKTAFDHFGMPKKNLFRDEK